MGIDKKLMATALVSLLDRPAGSSDGTDIVQVNAAILCLVGEEPGLGGKYFDGNGNFVQHDYRGNTSPIQFSAEETRTYKVSSDCTGSLTTQVGGGGSVQALFVISDGGRHIHEVVGSLTVAGSNVPVQTSADDWKVAPEPNQQQ